MIKRTCAGVTVALLACLLAGCPEPSEVSVAPGSTREHLVFILGRDHGARPPTASATAFFIVYPCDVTRIADNAVWVIRRISDAPTPDRLTYGVAPAGYQVGQGPLPLAARCYTIEDGATGFVIFDVDTAGAIHVRSGRGGPSH